MQRKSTRKIVSAPVQNTTTPQLEEEKIITEEYIGEAAEMAFKDVTFSNVLRFLKYLIILILLLPWIVTVSSKVREHDYIPKLQKLIEDSFTCPVIIRGNVYNCTCENNTLTSSPGGL